MSNNPADFNPRDIVGDLFDPPVQEGEDEAEIEIVPSEDGDGFTINGPIPAILELFTSGIQDIVQQGAEVGEFSDEQVEIALAAVGRIRVALELDED